MHTVFCIAVTQNVLSVFPPERQLKQDADLDREAWASVQGTRWQDTIKQSPSTLEINEEEEERTDFHR